MTAQALTQREQRSQDNYAKARKLSYFRFQYIHRRFKVDCKTGKVDADSVQSALKTLLNSLILLGIDFDDENEECFYIHEIMGYQHNKTYGDENPYASALDESDEVFAKCIAAVCTSKEDEAKLLHRVGYTYGFSPILLLEDINKGKDLLTRVRFFKKAVDFIPTSWNFLQESKPNPLFFARDLCKVKSTEAYNDNFFYAYINVLDPELSPKDLRLKAKEFSKKVVNSIDKGKEHRLGDKTAANLELNIILSNIDRSKKRWKAQLETNIYLQILYFRNYLTPFYLTLAEINDILRLIEGLPHEQADPEKRLIGLALWDSVHDAVHTEKLSPLYPEGFLNNAIREVEQIVGRRINDERTRKFHRCYLLADLCIQRMDICNANQVTDKISDHFQFDNIY